MMQSTRVEPWGLLYRHSHRLPMTKMALSVRWIHSCTHLTSIVSVRCLQSPLSSSGKDGIAYRAHVLTGGSDSAGLQSRRAGLDLGRVWRELHPEYDRSGGTPSTRHDVVVLT